MGKIIKLTKGHETIVDDKDYQMLIAMGSWYVACVGNNVYAVKQSSRINGLQRTLFMHKIILNPPEGFFTDHINLNGLDNRKCNLRICTRTENLRNQRKMKNASSKYKGVSWHKVNKKWQVQIGINEKLKPLGAFTDEILAAQAYDKAALKHFGDFAKPNFKGN